MSPLKIGAQYFLYLEFGLGIKMSKTRFAAIIPNCISLNLSAICRKGLNNIPMNIVYVNKSPNVVNYLHSKYETHHKDNKT